MCTWPGSLSQRVFCVDLWPFVRGERARHTCQVFFIPQSLFRGISVHIWCEFSDLILKLTHQVTLSFGGDVSTCASSGFAELRCSILESVVYKESESWRVFLKSGFTMRLVLEAECGYENYILPSSWLPGISLHMHTFSHHVPCLTGKRNSCDWFHDRVFYSLCDMEVAWSNWYCVHSFAAQRG